MTPTTATANAASKIAVPAADREPGSGGARARWRDRFPPRPADADWPTTRLDRAGVDRLVAATAGTVTSARVRDNRRWGLPFLLDWLEDQPGDTWQDRWLASGADTAGEDWAQLPEQWLHRHGKHSAHRLELMTSSLLITVGADVLRPSPSWLLTGGKKRKLVRNMVCGRDREGFERLRRLCEQDEAITRESARDVLFRSAVIVAAKGGLLGDVIVGDVLEILDVEHGIRRRVDSAAATIRMLREAGILGADVPTFREIRSLGQRTVEQLVDRHPITCRPMRDLFVDYLRERQPAIDYSTLVGLAYQLVGCFWADLERHHPGIDSLRLPREVAGAWKRRLRTKTTTVTRDGHRVELETERLGYLDVLATVRAFYLDLAEWALEDPSRWGVWVAPCPISQDDLVRRKFVRRRKARMDSRTRDRLPVLPVLAETTNRWRRDAQALLGRRSTDRARTAVHRRRHHPHQGPPAARPPGQRVGRRPRHRHTPAAQPGRRARLLGLGDHRSAAPHRRPGRGTARTQPPQPGSIPAAHHRRTGAAAADRPVQDRRRTAAGRQPRTGRRPQRHHLPHPRPRRDHSPGRGPATATNWSGCHRPRCCSSAGSAPRTTPSDGTSSATLLDEALARTGLPDPSTGQPLRFTPHDFRRIFITDAVLNGLPPTHRADHRRSPRHQRHHGLQGRLSRRGHPLPTWPSSPADERCAPARNTASPPTRNGSSSSATSNAARSPSAPAAGRSPRPASTSTPASAARMLWPDPAQRARLVEIRDNLIARIAEAEREGWLGEVEGLQISLAGAEDKLAQIDRRTTTTVDLGIPTIPTVP